MKSSSIARTLLLAAAAALLAVLTGSPGSASAATFASCSAGAHTLSHFGDRLYPEQGNGGYTSLHTDVFMVYDAATNMFLPGNHVELTNRATQCLSDFSLDFERTNLNAAGPNLSVDTVTVNGSPATFAFVQPTYPGDPNGQDDPDPAAHAVSNVNPVSATNSNPPACSPQVNNTSQNGLQCPPNKLVITPSVPIPDGVTFTVSIAYTGRPGVHVDGDGSTEGWFRVNTAAAPNDGSFVTTEPIGTASWMPLNNHPSAKPTYDFYDTVNLGKTAIANGELVGATLGPALAPLAPTSVNPPDANFPVGSWTWHWHSPEPISNYLVENSIGSYDLTGRTSTTSGIQYYQAMASGLTAARKAAIKVNLDQQEDITEFQKLFNGPYPFTTAGIVVALPSVGFAEEMQTKITFGNGATSTPSLGTINHENMHQWFGDSVAEGAFNLTFWKEGFATLGEYLNTARSAVGGGSSGTAFENLLVARFNANYGTTSATFWNSAPSNPSVNNLFSTASTYTRPGTAYLALWRILGRDRMINAMKQIQSQHGGRSITESQLESIFHEWLPVATPSCNAQLDTFFTQWFDTPYANLGSPNPPANRPLLTGPGLAGPAFICYGVTPADPTGSNGWYTGDVSLAWQGAAGETTTTGCVDETFSTDGTFNRSCSATNTATASAPVSVTVKRDAKQPTVDYTGNAGAYAVDETVSIECSASDETSGVDTTTCAGASGPAYSFALGSHTLTATAQDLAGNVGSGSTTFTISVTFASLKILVSRFSTDPIVTKGLNDKLTAAAKAKTANARVRQLLAFEQQVRAQTGKALTAEQAEILRTLADALK